MLRLTPQSIRIVDCYDDGQDAKHFTFEPIGFVHDEPIQVGQFFMLSVPGTGLAPLTYKTLPDEKGRFVALIRKVGEFTQALFERKVGDVLGYNGPYGKGWPINVLQDKKVLIVAGGCGLALLAATVIYSAGDADAQVLKKGRAIWKSKLLMYETLLIGDATKNLGTPSEHIAQVLTDYGRQPKIVLTSGPEAMMKPVADTCMGLIINSDKIWLSLEKRMRCGVGPCGHCYLADKLMCKQGPTYSYDKLVQIEVRTTQFRPHTGLFNYC